jgi:hypothetical protein
MKKTSNELKLATLALMDDAWDACDARLRSEGLAALRTAKRNRNVRVLAGQISALLIVFATVWWNTSPGSRFSPGYDSAPGTQPQNSPLASSHYITEKQMLEMFPKGSCVLAEVNGQMELVFLDAERARRGFDVRGNSR